MVQTSTSDKTDDDIPPFLATGKKRKRKGNKLFPFPRLYFLLLFQTFLLFEGRFCPWLETTEKKQGINLNPLRTADAEIHKAFQGFTHPAYKKNEDFKFNLKRTRLGSWWFQD